MNWRERMTRCECHETEFADIAETARRTGVHQFDQVLQVSGCGKTCTACHCDLKHYLRRNLDPGASAITPALVCSSGDRVDEPAAA